MKEYQIEDNVPPDIAKGIRDTIGRKNVVILKKMVKLEKSHNRIDAKVLVLTPYRVQLLGVKPPFKMEAEFHFLDIKSMDSPKPEVLAISTKPGKVYNLQMIGIDDSDHIIGRVALSLRTIFPHVALSRILKATLEPQSRQKVIQDMLNQADEIEPGPCGNFTEMYRCICDYLGAAAREDIEWDVDTIYLSQNIREINLSDFDLPDSKDVVPVICVLIYNRWFEGLVVRNVKLNNEIIEFILKVTRRSSNLKELTLDGVGLKGEFAHRLSTNLIENKETSLEVLNLSNNQIDDKGLLHLSGALPLIKQGKIRHLNFAKTGLTSKGVNGLCQALRSSAGIMKSLTHLDLSGNSIKTDDAEGLYNFLSNDNHLTDLDLTATDCSVDAYLAALGKGCTEHLQNVKLGKNHFYAKKKDSVVQPTFQEFFEKTKALMCADFSNMKLPSEALRYVMNGLLRNTTSGLAVELNLANCELKSAGCQVLQSTIASATNLAKLDVSENSFDSDLIGLLAWIQQNKSLKELNIGKNFFGVKPKNMKKVMEALMELVQEEESRLESLCLADSKIREYLHTFLGCLGSNTSLTYLDISGNFMGDSGSRVLAKSLQINSKLRIVKMDRNNISALGFHEIAHALEKNYTLRYMPYPVNDVVAAMKHSPERVQSSLTRIQDLLLRNMNVNHANSEQQFRLQKVMTNSAQQVLDKVAEKVDDALNSLEKLDADLANTEDAKKAKKLVRDAKNSKQLLSDMYGLATEKTCGHSSRLHDRISEAAEKMDAIAQDHYKEVTSVMLRNVESQCPYMYEEIKDSLQSCVDQRCQFAPGSVRDDVIKTSGADLVKTMSELNLSMATLVSDAVTDKLLASLSHFNVILTEQLNAFKNRRKNGPSAAETAKQEKGDAAANDKSASETVDGGKDDKETQLLPNMRKERAQSIAKRRQRPVAKELDKDKRKSVPIIEEPNADVNVEPLAKGKPVEEDGTGQSGKYLRVDDDDDDALSFASRDTLESTDDFFDTVSVQSLDHITKNRPRGPHNRQKRKKAKLATNSQEQNVDSFFVNSVSNTDFNDVPTVQEEEEIKKKEETKEKKTKVASVVGGSPLVGLDALKARNKLAEDANEKDDDKTEEKVSHRNPLPKPRPKTMMAVPGMGFGNNFLSEFKNKKLAKKQDDDSKSSPAKNKAPSPRASPKNGANINNNNSAELPLKPTPRTRVSAPPDQGENATTAEKSEKPKEGKTALMPTKPLAGRLPPPLPTKPKPPLLRGADSKQRPVSEFHEGKLPPLFLKPKPSSLKSKMDEKDGN